MSDRYAYIFRGDPSRLGFWMVRISNFLVYFMTLFISHALTLYLCDLFRSEGKLTVFPMRIWICEGLFGLGLLLLIVSQFTGLYYTFDAQNTYQRAPANLICYIVPFLITFLQISMVVQYRKLLRPVIVIPLGLNTLVPLAASIVQIFTYGVSLTNMTVVGMAIVLYIFVVRDLRLYDRTRANSAFLTSSVTPRRSPRRRGFRPRLPWLCRARLRRLPLWV